MSAPTNLSIHQQLARKCIGMPGDYQPAPKWLIEIDSDFKKRTNSSLVELNDDRDFTFPEIATLLELVYIHKILD